ncbi:MAG TPA: methyl-accepting chemotaxis protein, partial [Ktedonobacteraceae bacterium]|nr:methyl-accepting chemotaxis protein [Ktedonobacteraceae bacterium]
MSTLITNIPISRRLAWAFLLAALIPGLAISALGFIFSNIQNERSLAVQTSIGALKATMAGESYLQNMNASVNLAYQDQYVSNSAVLQGQTQGIIKNIRNDANQFSDTAKQYQQSYQIATSPQMNDVRNILLTDNPDTLLPNKQQQSITLVQDQLWPDYRDAQDQLLRSITLNAPKAQVNALLDQVRQKYTPLEGEWEQISQISEDMSNRVAQVGPSQMNPVITSAIITFLGTIIIISVIGYVIRRTITHPLIELATLTKRIAKGETNARALISGRDEIHIVANSMNNMLDNIVRLIQETQSQRDTLQAQVEKLVSEVSGVGEGDLRVQAEVTADALGVLADSFNYMVEELGSLVVRVKMVAHEVGNSTTAILDRMTQLVETGDQQINQIAGAVVEVDQMTASSRQVAERAQVLYDVARVARQDAQVGRESVMQAIEGMGRINENVHATASKVQILGDRSREINDIVEAISSIAHQTNRLALDAAIQAAMAGENGKGFGAVAADIRRLAERAKDQAGTITRIVRSVREDIGAVAVSMQ